MIITIDVAPDTGAHLQEAARRVGLPVEQYVSHLVEQTLVNARRDPAARISRFERWAESHGRDTPLLPDEAISRDAIYGGE